MSQVKYQPATPCEARKKATGTPASNPAQAPPGPDHGAGHAANARTRDLQRSLGNQGVLRLLRQQSDAANSGVAIHGAIQPEKPDGVTAEQQAAPTQSGQAGQVPAQPPGQNPAQAPAQTPGQAPAKAARQNMPYTAMFSMARHNSASKKACKLPDTPNCVVSLASWRLVDSTGASVPESVDLTEKFTKKSGPDDLFKKLVAQANSTVTSSQGAFDDCYGLCVPDGSPDFQLEVEQNYLVDNQIASKSYITYSPAGVKIRVCQREADGTFGNRCRRF